MDNKSGNNESTRCNNSNFSQKLVCVNYPGIVNNVDEAITTLGGMSMIETCVGTQRRNLEVKFKPEDIHCKPIISDLDKSPGILLKLKVKQTSGNINKGTKEPNIDYKVVGITALNYSFNKMFDFQYLPLVPEVEPETNDTPLQYIYNKIIPDSLPDFEWLTSEESKNLPLFLPPVVYSRIEYPQNSLHFDRSKFYEGRFKPEHTEMLKSQEKDRKSHVEINKKLLRRKCGHGGIFCSFADTSIPMTAPTLALEILNFRIATPGAVDRVKALFEDRPIWSRNAIVYMSKVSKEELKFILPAVAYYYCNGPWRVMWVRYGYDPRKDPNSRIYQTFDFRVRSTVGLKVQVPAKRYYKTKKYVSSFSGHVEKFSLKDERGEIYNPAIDESSFILKPNVKPPARQLFYQYCSVQIPEIESMLSRLPPVKPGETCDFKNGWLPNKFTEQCREIVNKYMVKHITQELAEENQQNQSEGTSEANQVDPTSEEPANDLMVVSDSSHEENTSDEEYIPSQFKELVKKIEEDGDNESVDIENAEEVNRAMDENYAALRDFDMLIYDSDSD